MDRPRNPARGLTMIEVLVSFSVFAVMTLGVISLYSTSGHLNRLAQNRSIATSLAAERIAQIRTLPFRPAAQFQDYKLPEETADAGPPATFTTGVGAIPGQPGFGRVVTLSYDTPGAGLLTVKVEVFWNHPTQGQRSHELVTFLTPGI